eukprot:gene17076-23493_t
MASLSEVSARVVRLEGNSLFRKAFTEDPTFGGIRIEAAENAKRTYLRARDLAASNSDPVEWLYCCKNFGLTCLRLASLKDYQQRSNRELVLFQFREAIKHLSEAIYHGKGSSLGLDWVVDVSAKVFEGMKLATSFVIESNATNNDIVVDNNEVRKRCSEIESLVSFPNQKLAVVIANVFSAEEMIKAAVRNDEKNDWHNTLNFCVEVEQPISINTSTLNNIFISDKNSELDQQLHDTLEEKLNDLIHSRFCYLARAEAMQRIHIADNLKITLIGENESLDMELLWIIIDHYRSAMLIASYSYPEKSHEVEAIAASKLGALFQDILLIYSKARELFLHCIQLCVTITESSGSVFFHKDWYQIAKSGIEKDNKRKEAYDNEKIAAEKAPTLLKLKPQLDKIDEEINKFNGRDYQGHAVLVHLYTNHPPKDGKTHALRAGFDRDDSDQ